MKFSILLLGLLFSFFLSTAQNNVGIGTTSPSACALLDLTSTNKGFLFPRMTYSQRIAIGSLTPGLLVYQTNAVGLFQSGIYFYDGTQWKRIARSDEITGGGSSGWTISGDDQYSNLAGNVGIGTSDPTAKLHLVGNLLQVSGTYTMNNASGILQFQNNAVNKGFVQLSGNNLRLGTSTGNSLGRFIVRMNSVDRFMIDSTGEAGLGTSSPIGQLHIRASTGNDALTIHTQTSTETATIQFYNSTTGGSALDKKAFLQLSDTEDLRLGTNSGNSSGKMIIRMNGSDNVIFSPTGNVGIGTAPIAKLHIDNGQDADPNPYNGNGYLMMGEVGSTNLILDNNEILARNALESSPLTLQNEGGDLKVGSTNRLFVGDNGNVGIGTATSTSKLQIPSGNGVGLSTHGYLHLGQTTGTNVVFDNNEIQARNNGGAATLFLQRSGGYLDIGSAVRINPISGSGELLRLEGINPNIGFYYGNYYSFISQTDNKLWIGVNGGPLQLDGTQIAIGSINTNAPNYKLTVSGKVICEELKVELYGSWPDYVFADEYQLQPLHELKSFIDAHHHLPNIPKATEVAKDGFEVGEMNRKLLEKVEELTLYVIQLQEQIDQLQDKKQ